MKKLLQMFALMVVMVAPWAANAQFCTPSPSSIDGSGITNVTFGTGSEMVNSSVTWSSSPYYIDNSNLTGAVPAGLECEMSITFATGYSYGTIIWVDWNQDSVFSGSEVVWVGESTNSSPTTLEVSFEVPATQPVDDYLMRICAADMAFDSYTGSLAAAAGANPCSSYSWGVALDYTLSVTEAASCFRVQSIAASGITADGMTLNWVDTLNTTTYTLAYWPAGAIDAGDTVVISGIAGDSYTISGLEAQTNYYISILPDCSDGSVSPRTCTAKTDCASGSCEIAFDITDSFGDGWNGNALNVMQGGTLMASITIASGSSYYGQVMVCSGVPVEITYTKGSYPDEMGGTVVDGGGVVVFTIVNMSSHNTGDVLATIANSCPSCVPPMDLTTDADMNQIEFSWTPRSGADVFVVYLNGEVVDDYVIDTFYTFDNLNANTVYTLGVQSICSDDDSSNVVSTSVRTDCGPIAVPFYEDFEGYANGYWPPCWHRLRSWGTDPSVNSQYHASGAQSMFLLTYQDTNLFVTPSEVPLPGNEIQVSYKVYMSSGDTTTWLKVGVMSDTSDMSTFVMLDSVGYHNFNYEFEERDFNTTALPASESYFIAWMFYGDYMGSSGWSTPYSKGAVDDISITQYTGCSRPATASVGIVGARQVELTWESVEGANGYTVYYGTVNNPTSSTLDYESASDTAFLLDGLQPETQYYVWVATNCASGESDLRYAGSFTTLVSCPPVTGLTVDTTTTDGATIHWTAGDLETEWFLVLDSTEIGIVTDTVYTIYGLDPMTGHTLYVRAYCDDDDTSAVRSVNFATACDDATCSFVVDATDSYGDGWNGNSIDFYQAGIMVGSTTIASGSSAIETVEVCSSAPVEVHFTSGMYAYEMGGTVYDGGGNTVFTIDNMNNYTNGALLATVDVPCPTCIAPTNFYLSDTTANGVTLHWSAQEDQTAWIVRIDSTDYYVNDTFFTVSNLAPRTLHTAMVATDCSDDISSFLSLPFYTGCEYGECEITVTSTSDYSSYAAYNPTLHVYQNGIQIAVVNGSTEYVSVCTGIPVAVTLTSSDYNWDNPRATILDGGDEVLFDGSTDGFNNGDTLAYMVNACPSCLKPVGVYASQVDSNQITFVWTVEGGYTYLVSFDSSNYVVNNTGSYTAYGLGSNTPHTFAVKAVCALGDTSNARIVNVKTACGEMTIPYFEGFEGQADGDVPSCWNVVSIGSDNTPVVYAYSHTGEHGIVLTSDANDTAMIASSAIPLPGDSIKVSFWADVEYGGGSLEVGMMTNPYLDTTFTSLMTVTSEGYNFYEFNTSTLSNNSTYYLAFRFISYSTYYTDNAFVDDITIMQDEGCMTPFNVTATPDTNTANIVVTWTNSASFNDFVVRYRVAGDPIWSNPQYTSLTTKTLTGLSYATNYEIQVGLLCGNDTLWAPSIYATSICGIINVPYTENFVGYNDDDPLPECWTYDNGVRYYDGGAMWSGNTGNGSTIAVVPRLDASPAKLQVTFDVKMHPDPNAEGIMIGVADAMGNLLAWLDTLTHPSQSRSAFVTLTAYFPDYDIPSNALRVVFGHKWNGNDWTLIDNINIIELANCYPVDSLAGHNLDDLENTTFSWTPKGSENEWQVYYDTVTVTLDSLENIPASNYITVTDTFYTIPTGTITGGGIYNFYVRANCGLEQSNWQVYEFGAGTVIMNQSSVADTVTGCGMVIYDNGGPIAGYITNSSSALVVRTENAGMQLEVFGGKFGFGSSQASLTIYDGEGTNGTELYVYNTIDGRDTLLDTVLAVSTTGSLTITFSAGMYVHTGYELYVHCVGEASCLKPTNLTVEMTGDGTAHATWDSTGASYYRVYHRVSGDANWNMNPAYTNSYDFNGLPADVMYEFRVVGICSVTDSSVSSSTRSFSTHWVEPCLTPEDLQVNTVNQISANIGWTSNGTLWEVELIGGAVVMTANNPFTLTGLTANMNYSVRVRNVCDTIEGRYSEWSAPVEFTTLPGEAATYTIVVTSNNNAWGTVTGSGSYPEGSSCTIRAVANDGYHFVSWQDGNSEAERTFIVVADASFEASFAANTGIDEVEDGEVTLFPNPASTLVTIRGIEEMSQVAVVDLNGREVFRTNADNTFTIDISGYAKGAYFVRITGEHSTAIRKLVVK